MALRILCGLSTNKICRAVLEHTIFSYFLQLLYSCQHTFDCYMNALMGAKVQKQYWYNKKMNEILKWYFKFQQKI